jgi:hypothetical protein
MVGRPSDFDPTSRVSRCTQLDRAIGRGAPVNYELKLADDRQVCRFSPLKNPAPVSSLFAISALTVKAKLSGHWVDRAENKTSNVIYAISDREHSRLSCTSSRRKSHGLVADSARGWRFGTVQLPIWLRVARSISGRLCMRDARSPNFSAGGKPASRESACAVTDVWLKDIRLTLNGSASLIEPFPARPKGMHHKRYARLWQDYQRADAKILAGFNQSIERLARKISK